MSRFLIRATLAGAGLFLAAPGRLQGQDSFTITRGDEPGDRDFEFNEETFLNILSFAWGGGGAQFAYSRSF